MEDMRKGGGVERNGEVEVEEERSISIGRFKLFGKQRNEVKR